MGANLLVAWVAVDGGDPSALTNTPYNWQALPVYDNAAGTHGRFFYAVISPPGSGTQTFTVSGNYASIAVSAWSGMNTSSAVCQGSAGVEALSPVELFV